MNRIELKETTEQELSKLSDQELMDEAKKLKSFSITNALLVGFFAGIIIFSVAKSTWGLLTIIPLYYIYGLVNDPKNIRLQVLEKLMKERNLR